MVFIILLPTWYWQFFGEYFFVFLAVVATVHILTRVPVPVSPIKVRRNAALPVKMSALERDLLQSSATKLAALIRDGTVSSETVCRTYIARQQATQGLLNAVVANRYDEAIADAKAADRRIARFVSGEDSATPLPPFLGVPCTIKEAFAVANMPHTSGHKLREHVVADSDAISVSRLRERGGFIVLAVTNTSELCMWWESNNLVYGRTNNPYDLDHIVGGSSGGEACIVAACGAPCGLGSDIGGSIRMPCFFNGVFGHKPSSYLVDNSGQFPCAEGEAQELLCTGPIARHAEDLWPMLNLLCGGSGGDAPGTVRDALDNTYSSPVDNNNHSVDNNNHSVGTNNHADDSNSPSSADNNPTRFALQISPCNVNLRNLRIFYDTAGVGQRILVAAPSLGMVQIVTKAAKALANAGLNVSKCPPLAEFQFALSIWSSTLSTKDEHTFRHRLTDGGHYSYVLRQAAKMMVGSADHTFPALALALVEDVNRIAPSLTQQFVEHGKALRQQLEKLLQDNGVLLFMSHPETAQRHGEPTNLSKICSFAYTAIFNVLGMPVTQVPLGFDKETGLPHGIQVVAAHGNDHLCIAVALELERIFGGWKAPP